MTRTLVLGFGNVYRADDGVAHYVVNALRRHLGQESLGADSTGLEELGAQVDSVFLSQLVPELIDTLTAYEQVVFVDAHVRKDVPDLHCVPVPAEGAMSAFTHHMTPSMLLALLKGIYHHEPAAYLVSIRGREFDFRRGLSARVEALVQPAVECILQLLAQPDGGSTSPNELDGKRSLG